MILDEFARRVRFWLRDKSQEHFDLEDDIAPVLDNFIREHFFDFVKVDPRYYFKREDYTGIVDAKDTDNELYLFPDDFYAVGNVRRSDLTDKPRLKYVGDHLDIQRYRYAYQYPFYDPDPQIPFIIYETWTMYDEKHWRLIPEPKSTSYTYWFSYYRKWTEAVQGGDTVDVPDLALSYTIAGTAIDILIAEGNPASTLAIQRLERIRLGNENVQMGVVPEVDQWW